MRYTHTHPRLGKLNGRHIGPAPEPFAIIHIFEQNFKKMQQQQIFQSQKDVAMPGHLPVGGSEKVSRPVRGEQHNLAGS